MFQRLEGQSGMDVRKASPLKSLFPVIVITLALVIAILVYIFVLGNHSNFEDNDPKNNPEEASSIKGSNAEVHVSRLSEAAGAY